jgi:hypothetical protein
LHLIAVELVDRALQRIYTGAAAGTGKIQPSLAHNGKRVSAAVAEVFMLDLSLRCADHVRHYSISAGSAGWEVKLEEDRTLRRLDHYRDWHRVERAMALFEREVMDLTSRGWQLEDIESLNTQV